MVKIAYTQYGIVGPPAVNRSTLSSTLQTDGALYNFLTYLLQKQNYWPAAHVMTACFQLSDADCARIWRSAAGFLQGGSGGDDEPTACFRMTVLQTFMEGLLCLSFGKPATHTLMNQGALPSWNKLLAERERLVALLRTVSKADVWTNSRCHLRCRILDLDKQMFDRNTRYSRQEESGDRAELLRLETDARQNHDYRLLDCIRWRKEVLMERKDPKAISSVAWYLAMPFDIYTRRYELVRNARIVSGSNNPPQAGIPIQSQTPNRYPVASGSKQPVPINTMPRDKPRAPGPAQQGITLSPTSCVRTC